MKVELISERVRGHQVSVEECDIEIRVENDIRFSHLKQMQPNAFPDYFKRISDNIESNPMLSCSSCLFARSVILILLMLMKHS